MTVFSYAAAARRNDPEASRRIWHQLNIHGATSAKQAIARTLHTLHLPESHRHVKNVWWRMRLTALSWGRRQKPSRTPRVGEWQPNRQGRIYGRIYVSSKVGPGEQRKEPFSFQKARHIDALARLFPSGPVRKLFRAVVALRGTSLKARTAYR